MRQSRADAPPNGTRSDCLGDTFDDLRAAELGEAHALWLARLMAGRRWVWIEGNHDPGPVALGGEHRADLRLGPLTFRHVAETGAGGEVSAVTPFRYTRLLFGVALGMVVFGERPEANVWIGSAIVVAAGLFTLWRGRRLQLRS